MDQDSVEIVGRTITTVRELTAEELEREGWEHFARGRHGAPLALVLDDGTILYASRDHEGNGPGALFGQSPDGEGFYVAG